MKHVTLVLGDFEGPIEGDVIGVDYGALVCLNKGIPMTLACGDFDSVTPEQKNEIKNHAKQFIELPAEKDDTDFSFAYKQCESYDSILVLGGLGGRRDHEYVHIVSAIHDSRIALRDEHNYIRYYEEGSHTVSKNGYFYLSVIVTEPIVITFEGLRYPLNKRSITPIDTYLTSNEILEETGVIHLEGGGALIIQSNDAKKDITH